MLLLCQQSGARTLIVTALGSCSSLPVRRSTADTAVLAAAAARNTAQGHTAQGHSSQALSVVPRQGSSVCVGCQATGQVRYQLISTFVSKINNATIKSASCIFCNVPLAIPFHLPKFPSCHQRHQVVISSLLPATGSRLQM